MNKWLLLITQSKFIQGVIGVSKKIVLPGFDGHSLYYITRFFFRGINEGAIGTRAASISFRVIMAILPFFIMLLSFIPFIKIGGFQENLFLGISSIMPADAYKLMEDTVNQMILDQNTTILSIGFLLTLYYASNSISAILIAFNGSVNLVEKRTFIVQKLISLLLILVFAIFIFLAVGLITASNSLAAYLEEIAFLSDNFQVFIFYAINYVVTLILFMIAISILFYVGNPDARKWRLVSAGSIFSSVLMILVSFAFAYFVNNFGNYNKFYGGLGAVIAFFIWINFNSTILIMGFELNTSISRATIHKNSKKISS
ncbi:MAG: membrane protein [Patiriisocius sp.]|jgi:membrane protein